MVGIEVFQKQVASERNPSLTQAGKLFVIIERR